MLYPSTDPLPIRLRYRYNGPIHETYATYHTHPQYEIYYFHSGRANFLIADQLYVLVPGDLIIMDGLTLHCPKIEPGFEYVRTTIHFDPAYVTGMIKLPEPMEVLRPFQMLRNRVRNLQGADKTQLEESLQRLHLINGKKDPVSYNRFCLQFIDLLLQVYEIFRGDMAGVRKPLSEKEKNVQKIVSYIERHYVEDLHLDRLEQDLHLDKHYMSNIFKEVTGTTIFSYLYQRRVNQSRIIFLLDSSQTVTEVCFRVGFKHVSHFCRIFKKLVGMTPETYRKTMNNMGKGS